MGVPRDSDGVQVCPEHLHLLSQRACLNSVGFEAIWGIRLLGDRYRNWRGVYIYPSTPACDSAPTYAPPPDAERTAGMYVCMYVCTSDCVLLHVV